MRMKTVKAKVCKYDCKTHKMEIVDEEMPIYTKPKPIPLPQEVHIKKIAEEIIKIKKWIDEVSEKLNITSPDIDIKQINNIIEWYSNMYK